VVPLRVLIATTDRQLRLHAREAFEEVGCAVMTAAGGTACLGKVRAARPDLLVLLPPLRWGSLAGILAALRGRLTARQVPVLILPTPTDDLFPRVPRLFTNGCPDFADAFRALIERVRGRLCQVTQSAERDNVAAAPMEEPVAGR